MLLLASGRAGNPPLRSRASRRARAAFVDALREVATELARALARDGEGATKLVDVVGARAARSEAEALLRGAAHRQLDAGQDGALRPRPELGPDPPDDRRGPRGDPPARARQVRLGGRDRVPRGRLGRPGRAPARRASALAAPEVAIEVDLGAGRGSAHMWTCDLSTDYVRINAEYTT